MVGRRQETGDVRTLVGTERLITLIGSGGVGKTRVALQVARSARRTFSDGAWFVELGSVRDPALVAQVVVDTLKIPDSSARDPRTVLIDFLRERQVLLVLDNCEHLLVDIATMVDAVLRAVPGAHVLATSRQPLGVPGEATYRVAPLAVPDMDPASEAADVSGFAAVELFATRARGALGEFEVDSSNHHDVVRLCAKLEGIPLALELAASRLKVMTVEDLLQRLDDRFLLLKGTSSVGVPRHQTMIAAVAWSHDLCTPEEQLLWRRASVFTGTFSLAAAEDVCSGGELAREQVLEVLLGLVEKSVVINEQRSGKMRFRMLETIRDFGADRLVETSETEELQAAHAAWTSALLDEATAAWFGDRQAEWTVELRLEQANIRAALDYCADQSEHARTGLKMAGACWFLWVACGYLSEGRLWLERLLAATPESSPERALALATTAYVSVLQGDSARGALAAAECEQIANDLAEPVVAARGVHMRALCAFLGNEPEQAEALFRRASSLYAEAEAPEQWQLTLLAQYAMHVLRSDVSGAAGMFREVEAACERYGEKWVMSYALWGRGLADFHAENYDEAETLLLRSVELKRPFHDITGLALSFDVLAWVLAAKGEATRAARIVGAASALWSTFGADLFGTEFFKMMRARCEGAARDALGSATYEDEVRRGAVATLDETLRLLLDDEPSGSGSAHKAVDSLLTKREREVARLVADGLTNQEIADRLVISPRTAEGHVENVLRKLDFRSRTQIASWVASSADDAHV